MGVFTLIDGSAGWILGWTFLHSIWQGALVAAGLAIVLRFVPGTMSRLRAVAGWGALALVVVLAATTWVLVDTEWRGHAACWESEAFAHEQASLCAAHSVPAAREIIGEERVGSAMPLSWVRRIALPLPASVGSASVTVTGFVALLALVSGVLALAGLFRLALGLAVLHGILRRAQPMRDDACTSTLGWLATEMRIAHRVELMESAEVSTPAVAGWRRSFILVPSGLAGALEPEQMADVLAHELVHVRERHFALNLGQRVLDCLCAFNPFALWISGRIREEREIHCDRVAAGNHGRRRRRYVETLLQLEHLRGPARPALIGLLGEGSLLRRIRRLADAPGGVYRRRVTPAVVAAAVAAVTVLGVVHVSMTTVALTSWSVMSHDIELRHEAARSTGEHRNQSPSTKPAAH